MRLEDKLLDGITMVPDAGCWLWERAVSTAGYGQVRDGKKLLYTHRLAYELFNGEIPEGMFVLHRCDVRCCCNPDHLFVGTNADNMRDKIEKGRQTRGSKCGTAKLTEADVVEMRRRYASGERVEDIKKDYPVNIRNTYAAISGEWWAHVGSSLCGHGL